MYQEIIDKIKPEFDKVIVYLENELAKIRTSGASTSLVEDIEVDCFGQNFSLKQLAAISVTGPREITIQPWDKSYFESIEKAVARSSIGASPVADGEVIRLSLPLLSSELRENLSKVVAQKKEEARQTIRKWRGDAWDQIQNLTAEGKIREDDKFRAKDKLQELIDEYNEKIDKLIENKLKEISL
ncbi:MAG: ribosome recycling factor [Patescibacteria group bacterium]|nr:ribosome recycling factor [Patescibacteria group bacterium]MBU1876862.1 ribosome recycling factor [Patescibacteria group bacterium]